MATRASCGNGRQRVAQQVDVLLFEDVGRQQPQHVRIGRWCRRGCRSRAAPIGSPSPDAMVLQPDQQSRALKAGDRADQAAARGCTRDTCRTRSSSRSDSIASITASIAAQAIGPPPKVVPSVSGLERALAMRRDSSSAAHGKPLPSALAVVSMSGRARRSSWPRTARRCAPCRTAPRRISAAPRPRRSARAAPAGSGAPRSKAPPSALHRLDDHRGRVAHRWRAAAASLSRRGDEAHVEGACAESRTTSPARPRSPRPPRRCGRGSHCSIAADVRAPASS